MSGGKGGTSTSSVTIPPEVLARYNAVNARAEGVSNTPFQSYTGQFVAPLTSTQQAGIANTNTASTEAQPYYGAATGQLLNAQGAYQPYQAGATALALGAANPVNAQGLDIGQYMNPYLGTVLGSTAALLNQNNQQQQAGQLGTAIKSGAFGGDRAGIAAANLAQQQNLSNANIYSNIASQGFNTALGAAQQQQGVNLSADQANRAALLSASNALTGLGQQGYNIGANTATTLAGLGTGAQSAALQGAQAQLAAGQTEQQTQQAQDTAVYNQFLQQQSYPFQVAQFLANIAEGTGSLSGSTTTTNTVQNGIFSDKRLKENIKPIGKTFDGQTIYSYRYKGEKHTEIGLLAQEVEKCHPEAVGLAGGYKTVHYGKATDDAAERGHFATGGAANDRDGYYGGGLAYAGGGYDPATTAQLMANYQAMYGPLLAHGTAGGIVPQGNVPVQALHPAQAEVPQGRGLANTAVDYAKAADAVGQLGDKLGAWDYSGKAGSGGLDPKALAKGTDAALSAIKPATALTDDTDLASMLGLARGGAAYASGGAIPYIGAESDPLAIPDDEKRYELKTANSNGSSGSGGGLVNDIGSVASAGLSVAKLLPMLGLSDERAKEHIKPIGKTFDGQTVYSYNYKGDNTPRMGLIAQEVEKHHPGAVGIARGLKTVDYAKATGKAAKRGKFASGGDVGDYSDLVTSTGKSVEDSFAHTNQSAHDMIDDIGQSADTKASSPSQTDFVAPAAVPHTQDVGKSDNGPILNTSGKGTRADRNNNPGNIEAGSFAKKMPGYKGSDGRFAVFDTPEAGRNAQIALLKGYLNKGFDTPAKIAARWAPGAEKGNNPSQYAGFIASRLGIGPDDTVTADLLPKLASAQARMEGATKRGALATGGRAGYATDGAVTDDTPDPADLETAFDSDPELRKRAAAIAAVKAADVAPALAAASNATAGSAPVNDNTPAPPQDLALGSGLTGAERIPSSVSAGESLPSNVTAPGDVDVRPKRGFIKGLGHGDASSILPLLAGVGALASTQTNNPFTALAAGLGAGAQAASAQQDFRLKQQELQQKIAQNQQELGISQGQYQQRQQMLPYEQGQALAQIGLLGAQTGQINTLTPVQVENLRKTGALTDAQVQQIRAGNMEVKALPGVGVFAIDKVGKPGAWGPSIYKIPGSEMLTGTEGGATTGAPAATQPAVGRRPIVDVSAFAPAGVGANMLYPGADQRSASDQQMLQKLRDAANHATGTQMALQNMQQQASNIPETGWQAAGSGATWRNNILRDANSVLAVFGGAPIAPTAAGENLTKFTNILGAELAHTTAGRASGAVINLAIASNPGIENSPMAFKRLISAANQAAEYEKLQAQSAEAYYGKYLTLNGWLPAFQKANPPQMFARRAIMATVDPADAQYVRKNFSDPKARASFDRKYGNGTSAYYGVK